MRMLRPFRNLYCGDDGYDQYLGTDALDREHVFQPQALGFGTIAQIPPVFRL